jgi:heavy metal translocating P-type ATPase/RND family efflux transporter MFP subunit
MARGRDRLAKLLPGGGPMPFDEQNLRRALLTVALVGLLSGVAAGAAGLPEIAHLAAALGAAPALAHIAASILAELRRGRAGVDLISLISIAGALALGESLAAVIVAVMYEGGNMLEGFAVGRAQRDLKALVDRAPRIAHRKHGDEIQEVPIETVAAGDVIMVRAGEVVPADGLVLSPGGALIDEAALTGEPIPIPRKKGELVRSGTVNAGAAFEMQASAAAGESAYSGIVRMATAAQAAKAPFMRAADRYALLLLPVTLIIAGAAWLFSGDPIRALAVVVAATPCPLILAAPAAFIGGTSQAARRGILVKGGGPIEALARVRTVMFDKTGTLTVGGARLIAVETAPGTDADEALRLAASIEQASHHVVGAAIVEAARSKGLALSAPQDVRETLGSGLEGLVDGKRITVGSPQMVAGEAPLDEWAQRAVRRASWRSALTVLVASEARIVAVLLFADELRRETPRTIQALRNVGARRIVMVTGDRAEPAETIADALDIDAVLAERAPSEKVDAVAAEKLAAPTLMVGDGINDAPALAAADVGMAMGARGASASSEAADVVILVDRLDRVPEAMAIARRTEAIALQSIFTGMSLSGCVMIAAAFGYVTPVAGALLQEVIDVAVILNALRALGPQGVFDRPPMPEAATELLRQEHEKIEVALERLRSIADALDGADAASAAGLVSEATGIVSSVIVDHEKRDEAVVYPGVGGFLQDSHGLSAMSGAHREIQHQARLLERLSKGLGEENPEPHVVRDAQHIIETIEALVRIHNAQEEDIYQHAATPSAGRAAPGTAAKAGGAASQTSEIERAMFPPESGRPVLLAAAVAAILAIVGGGLYWSLGGFGGDFMRSVAWEATIEAPPTKQASATIPGVVAAVDCDVGRHVDAGQACAALDRRPYELQAKRAETALAEARLRLGEANSAATSARRRLAQSRLAGSAKKAGEIARKRLDVAQQRTADCEAEVELALAALRSAQDKLAATTIRAPIAGAVITRDAKTGDHVNPGQPLFTFGADVEAVKIVALVTNRAIEQFKVGDKVSFVVDSDGKNRRRGTVTQISLRPENPEIYDLTITTNELKPTIPSAGPIKIRIAHDIADR